MGSCTDPIGDIDLWPRPTVEESFAELLAADQARMAEMRAAIEAMEGAKEAASDVAQKAADTVRLSIMQRDNERRQAASLMAERDALAQIGGQLSNVAFNWSRQPGYVLTERDAEMLGKLRRAWDEARSAK